MGVEIERKFLVRGDAWKTPGGGVRIRQGYLSALPERVVRVRTYGDKAYLTVKGPIVGVTRAEFEYEIPVADAEELFPLCQDHIVEKTRYRVDHAGLTWEVDEFHGANAGLVVAECELASEDQAIDPPPWLGEEVSDDRRYANARLAARPFGTW